MKVSYAANPYVAPGIIILTAATGLIHLSLNFVLKRFDVMFTLNGLGYMALLAALFLDIPIARENRRFVRFGLIGFTAVTIVAWLILGDMTWWLGWLTKVIELALIGLLILKRP